MILRLNHFIFKVGEAPQKKHCHPILRVLSPIFLFQKKCVVGSIVLRDLAMTSGRDRHRELAGYFSQSGRELSFDGRLILQ
jgi:hypothetical protein